MFRVILILILLFAMVSLAQAQVTISGGNTGITNGAGANAIPKSDGTNLVTGSITDSSTVTAAPSGGLFDFRNGTSAQKIRVFGTADAGTSTPTNYVLGSLTASTSAVTLAAESGGMGSPAVPIYLSPRNTATTERSLVVKNDDSVGRLTLTSSSGTVQLGDTGNSASLSGYWTANSSTGYLNSLSASYQLTFGNQAGFYSPSAGIMKDTNASTGLGKHYSSTMILKDSDAATCHEISVNATGTISAATITCP